MCITEKERLYEALLDYENFQSVTLKHSVLGDYHLLNYDVFYRMDDGEYYVNGKRQVEHNIAMLRKKRLENAKCKPSDDKR